MRRPLLAIALLAIALSAGACAASEALGWTYAPPTEAPAVTPVPSGDASVVPSEAPSAAPSDNSSGGGGDGTVIEISALNIAFEQTAVSAPADAPFVIRFDNKDAGIPHNVEIKDAAGMVVFKGDIFNGVAQVDYQVPALAAGTYPFICTVHPNMVGTLTVGG